MNKERRGQIRNNSLEDCREKDRRERKRRQEYFEELIRREEEDDNLLGFDQLHEKDDSDE